MQMVSCGSCRRVYLARQHLHMLELCYSITISRLRRGREATTRGQTACGLRRDHIAKKYAKPSAAGRKALEMYGCGTLHTEALVFSW